MRARRIARCSPLGAGECVGELNSRVTRWLDKVLTVDCTVSVSSPTRTCTAWLVRNMENWWES
eukprot:8458518-Pyramimonas_sp.AAC.1